MSYSLPLIYNYHIIIIIILQNKVAFQKEFAEKRI